MIGKDLCLFDVDGTLTLSRQPIKPEMKAFLSELQKKVAVGLVGGSDLEKIAEQIMEPNLVKSFDYVFAQNGLVAYKNGELIGKESILDHMGDEKLQPFINFCLHYMSKLTLPVKRGNFVEFRSGLINICPVGRTCSGQISFDCFPIGWDKTFCLRHINKEAYSNIHFFGDRTFPGGNDYELFKHEAVIGHTVTSPEDTMLQLKDLYFT
ncbi:phosphomannomutase [Caerostris extrusa]|uniref:Phosphomannomutase n=1 Tax=Caerostris extrusa TaxID=172846 RepID=A0AAV4WC79_CAEEX|nr:phosphomannomutase [Caerostris extrusa]